MVLYGVFLACIYGVYMQKKSVREMNSKKHGVYNFEMQNIELI